MELVGKRFAYESVCDFRDKAAEIDQAILDVRSSQAFKSILLDEILAAVTSLKYSPFLFGSTFLYEPSGSELLWKEDFKKINPSLLTVEDNDFDLDSDSKKEKI